MQGHSNPISFQEYLRKLRSEHGYSQQYVADKLHVIRQTYSHYETGRIIPPVSSIYALARLYDIDAAEIFAMAMRDEATGDAVCAHKSDKFSRSELLSLIDSLTPKQREKVIEMLRAFV